MSDLLPTPRIPASHNDAKPTVGLSIHDLRLPQDLTAMTAGSPVLVSVSVAKPPKASFFRTRAGAEFSANLNLLDASRMGGEGMYAVGAEVAGV